jgi:oxygen-independent coproporphyrinogen-3 oxidase
MIAAAHVAQATTFTPQDAAQIGSLYIHVPYCERKCEYCDFASVAGMRGHEDYVAALRGELRMTAAALPGVSLDTIFIGGGTPGLLPPRWLMAIMDEVRDGFLVTSGCEVTLEANPSSTTEERATAWLDAGFNRVSVGVQSLDAAVLRFLGRVHGPQRALDAVAAVQRAGFQRVNTDLIYAVPPLSDESWQKTVESVLELGCGHLSCYELTVEEGTPLFDAVAAGAVIPIDAETALRQHWMAAELAADAGLRQYEISNFARPGEECRHNLTYWQNRYYIAAGVGAHGHLPPAAAARLGLMQTPPADGAVRYWHSREPADYVAAVTAGKLPVDGAEAVGAAAREEERIMVGLRLREGVTVSGDAQRERARMLAGAGLLILDGDTVRATRRGQDMLNEVVVRLVATR